jgi:ADP-ribosylglycohydrolase
MATPEEKFSGCLLGGAIGDALGMPWEGKTRAALQEIGLQSDFVSSERVHSLVLPLNEHGETESGNLLAAGQWTDKTQLMLALAETLVEEGGLFVPEAWAHKIVRWVNMEPRAPGLSTLQAALQLRTGGVEWDEAADPEGAGCGPAARVAPIGLLLADDPERRRDAAVQQAQVTHGHPDAHAASLAVAEAVAWAVPRSVESLSAGSGVELLGMLVEIVHAESAAFAEFARCLQLAQTLLADEVDTETAIRVLGVSAWSREAVPCALYCVARTLTDFETSLIRAVNLTGGATDSIGAIAGAVGGALYGIEGIPLRWRAGVEEAPRIVAISRALTYRDVSLLPILDT